MIFFFHVFFIVFLSPVSEICRHLQKLFLGMEEENVIMVTNAKREVATQLDKQKVNHFRHNFSLVMDYGHFVRLGNIRMGQTYRTSEVCLLFATAGEAEIVFNGTAYCMRKGSVVVGPEQSTLKVLSTSGDFNARAMAFRRKHIDDYGVVQHSTLYMTLNETECRVMESNFRLLDDLCYLPETVTSPLEYACHAMTDYLYSLYMERNHVVMNNSKPQILFSEFLHLASVHAVKEKQVSFYAEKMGLSTGYLSTIVTKYGNKNAKEWISYFVTQEAKRQLAIMDKDLREISRDLGFKNPSQFGTFFKKETGMTPGEYRNSQAV